MPGPTPPRDDASASREDPRLVGTRPDVRQQQLAPPKQRGATMRDDEAVQIDGLAPDERDEAVHDRGERFGRYVLLDPIGSGGMGVVYAAYDPELDRRVALKLLRRAAEDGSSLGRARLLREAQAMAKVSHPNVITVFDVGTLGESVFVAMELVVGEDLRAWLDRPRSVDEILAVFVQAGRGLAAAHAVGLIHRDFKPGNVLVGNDGVVRVADFGLARRIGAPRVEPPVVEVLETPLSGTTVRDSVTRTGAVIGTPAYMAPEQHLGRELDARADQFSYCIALWEALTGARPFTATHPVELMIEITRGEIAPGRDAAIPGWIRAVLVRGLSVEPARRFPDMDALLAALARDPRRTRRRLAIASGAAALAIGTTVWLAGGGDDPCAGGDAELAEAWGPARREQLTEAFTATELRYAADVASGVVRRLDDYGTAWLLARTDACTATHVRGEQSPQTLERRMRCLDRRRRDLGALIDVLVQADAGSVERASESLQALRSLDACADPARDWGDVPVPDDPVVRASVEGLRDELGRINALDRAGRWREGVELAASVTMQAERLADPGLRAEAELSYGHVLVGEGRPQEGVEHLHEAAAQAVLAGHDEALLDAWISIVWHTGVDLSRPDEARTWVRYADAALERLGRPSRSYGNLRAAEGAVEWAAGRPEAALVSARASLAVRLEDQPGAAILANNYLQIGNILVQLARYDEADEPFAQSLRIAIDNDGPEHPLVSAIENSIGVRHFMAGDYQDAEEHWRRAYAIMEGALGADHPDLFYSLGNLAEAMREQGKYDEALATMARVLALQRKSLPPMHREIGTTHHNVGTILLDDGDAAAAVPELREALRIREHALDPGDPALANTLTALGEALLAQGHDAEVLPLLQRAQAIRDVAPGEPIAAARTRLVLGRALWIAGRDPARAHALVQDAAAALAQLRGPSRDRLAAAAAAWLAEHPTPQP